MELNKKNNVCLNSEILNVERYSVTTISKDKLTTKQVEKSREEKKIKELKSLKSVKVKTSSLFLLTSGLRDPVHFSTNTTYNIFNIAHYDEQILHFSHVLHSQIEKSIEKKTCKNVFSKG